MSKQHFWFKFNPADWLTDVDLRSCSSAARGTLVDLMCLAHRNDPYGVFMENDAIETRKKTAKLLSLTLRTFDSHLASLMHMSRICRSDGGQMFIKRMINDYEKSIKDAENGSKGGNPLLTRVNPEEEEEEEEEEEKNKIKTPTPKGARKPKPETAIPKELDTAKFREAWSDWQRYRAESRKKLTPSTIEKQLASLSKMGEPRAIAAINNSIQQGYQGIFEASGGGSGGGGGKINRNAHLKIEPDAAESWRD